MTRTIMINKTDAVCSHLIRQGELTWIRIALEIAHSQCVLCDVISGIKRVTELRLVSRIPEIQLRQWSSSLEKLILVSQCPILSLSIFICNDPMLKIYGKTFARNPGSRPTDLLFYLSVPLDPIPRSLPFPHLLWPTQAIPS